MIAKEETSATTWCQNNGIMKEALWIALGMGVAQGIGKGSSVCPCTVYLHYSHRVMGMICVPIADTMRHLHELNA